MFQRELVNNIVERIAEPRRFIQIVKGARQTGKTTAVTQAVDESGLPTYFTSADDAVIASRGWLENEWRHARDLAADAQGDVILVIDEVQKVADWSLACKALWDADTRKKIPLKVILTGSSSLLLQKGLAESLKGRFEIIESTQWTFAECQEAFGYSLEEFLYFGGYPGAAPLRADVKRWKRYLNQAIIEPTLNQDVLQMEEVRKPALLRALFKLGALYSAQELSYVKIMGQLTEAGNTTTLAHYLTLLDEAGLLCGLQKFSKNELRKRSSSPRFMVYDTALMASQLSGDPIAVEQDPGLHGHLVESAVGAYLLNRAKSEGFELHWWRSASYEADFVLFDGSRISAFEVKSSEPKMSDGLEMFARRYPETKRYVIGGENFSLKDMLLGKIPLF
jgi:predicted AAA+ superfamily ATPase